MWQNRPTHPHMNLWIHSLFHTHWSTENSVTWTSVHRFIVSNSPIHVHRIETPQRDQKKKNHNTSHTQEHRNPKSQETHTWQNHFTQILTYTCRRNYPPHRAYRIMSQRYTLYIYTEWHHQTCSVTKTHIGTQNIMCTHTESQSAMTSSHPGHPHPLKGPHRWVNTQSSGAYQGEVFMVV